jgi:muramoyltetrapeptide carboxypeptidase
VDVQWRRAAAYVVCRDGVGRVLLTRFVEPGNPDSGSWTLPGGGMERGEDPVETAHRELAEETGLTATTVGPVLGVQSRWLEPQETVSGESGHMVGIVHRAAGLRGELRTVFEEGSTDAAAWFTLDEIHALRRVALVDFAVDLIAADEPGGGAQASLTRPPKLVAGDRVAIVSPASTPDRAAVERCAAVLEGWGLRPEIAPHAFDAAGYLAGSDEDRLADLDGALRDLGIRAVFATRGGKGAYRIADGVDVEAARSDPKLLVGFSDITVLHLALARDARLAGLHGPMVSWDDGHVGAAAIERLRRATMTTDPIVVGRDWLEPTGALTTSGRATGPLIGGNQDSVATTAGWALPRLDGAILLLEAVNLRLGHIDRQLTMLANAGHLDGVLGVAVGQYTDCGPEQQEPPDWSHVEVLRHHLDRLDVPILGGLPIGHGRDPHSVPIGTTATLDADAGVLSVEPAVQ